MRLGVAAAVVEGRVLAGDLEIDDGRVSAVGSSPAGRGGIALPGFVDLQVNGYAGVDLQRADPDEIITTCRQLAATGVTALLATIHNVAQEAYFSALASYTEVLRRQAHAARLLGAHLEGPFLSAEWPGAHDRARFVTPDSGLMRRLLDAGPVRLVTLAPELDGARSVIGALVEAGVPVSMGHTDASTACAHQAVDEGVRAITHLWNAHRRWHSRHPGPGGVALSRAEVTVMLIADGIHVAAENVMTALAAARGRVAIVTDAAPATGITAEGAVWTADGTLAGSATSMHRAFTNLVSWGVSESEAAGAVSTVPARLVGHSSGLEPGRVADVVVLDDSREVLRTLVGGQEVHRA
ncbi:MAG: N-acetylglucosamine-6-phosphate deacetylase [Acidimicrobiales bacterium]|nr:MAG: N-acetylglucosamine-6-phosphate deacetylase [Actinomycetota bacterium]MBV6508940.1 N-acetylglucosamine-6-phosphate deacetylase [Acidimicrobiales bacterium]RIK08423.1 MAG: N-acetylglucosamine-6-phosphate deacetylase [Acidobacteriota bacterium]